MSKHQFLLPFEAIIEQPLLFALWVIVAIVIGLAGFWLPLFIQVVCFGAKASDVFSQLVRAAVLPGFGVVFISSATAEALVGTKTKYDEDTTRVLSTWRVIISVICLVLVLLQGGLLSTGLSQGGSSSWQWALFGVSLVLGIYLYGLRCNFNQTVEQLLLRENSDTKHLGDDGKKPRHDDSGVKL